MRPWRRALAAALVIGLAFPHAKLAWLCRGERAASEACVWGRAYLPVTRWAEPLVVTPIAFVGILLAWRALRRG